MCQISTGFCSGYILSCHYHDVFVLILNNVQMRRKRKKTRSIYSRCRAWCSVFNVHCWMLIAQCSVSNVRFSVFSVECWMLTGENNPGFNNWMPTNCHSAQLKIPITSEIHFWDDSNNQLHEDQDHNQNHDNDYIIFIGCPAPGASALGNPH